MVLLFIVYLGYIRILVLLFLVNIYSTWFSWFSYGSPGYPFYIDPVPTQVSTGCPIFYQVSFRGTFRVVPMSFESCPKLQLVVRSINFKIWNKKKVEVFCPILIRWIWEPYCEKFFKKVMTKKKFFLAIWDSISHELIRFEKKPTLVLSVPY